MSAKSKIAKLQAQIDALNVKIAELQAAADAEVDLSLAVPGASITATYGRGEKARTISGVLRGAKTNERGVSLYKIEVGEGVDAEFITVFANQITFVAAPVGYAEAPAAEVQPV
jgi:hypothetical protein